uniref:Secreted protein n=1 Tax=Parascaris univalens TaxID=6257 RepID=A0A914ZKK5_PARUN
MLVIIVIKVINIHALILFSIDCRRISQLQGIYPVDHWMWHLEVPLNRSVSCPNYDFLNENFQMNAFLYFSIKYRQGAEISNKVISTHLLTKFVFFCTCRL